MADVFISYARKDLERVRPLVSAIEGAGYSVFWDRKTPAGMTWRQFIGKALDEAKSVIVVWSESSITSDWVLEEADDGKERGILIPVQLDDVRPPLGFRSVQHENLREWDGDPEHSRAKNLLRSIAMITGVTPKIQTTFLNEKKSEAPPKSSTQTNANRDASLPEAPISYLGNLAEQVDTPAILSYEQQKALLLNIERAMHEDSVAEPAVILLRKFSKRSDLFASIAEGIDSLSNFNATGSASIPSSLEATDEKHAQRTNAPQSFTNSLGMKFVLVLAGTFQMGSDEVDREQPVHQVTIRKPFYMQTTQVTQGQWKKVMGKNPSNFQNSGDDFPVEMVSWDDIKQFLVNLNEKEDVEYRLPSEAEWEFAARSGGKDQTYAGGENLDELGWYDKNSGGRTHPVAQKKPNSLGIYDMSGNVDEWVEDDWHANYNGAPDDGSAWIDKSRGTDRVVRGGSWDYGAGRCRSATRYFFEPGDRYYYLGFRLSRSVTLGP